MNNFLKFVLKHKLICKIVLFLYALYCSVLIGISWDENYYKILGVDKRDDDRTIKKEYRKLALKWHQDKNPDDKKEEANIKNI